MKKRLQRIYANLTLAAKIRCSYFILLIPIVLFLVFCFYNLWAGNREYENMINSAVVASEFSLDFKKDFDYETYLLLVENKSVEESNLEKMLGEANRIVGRLEGLTDSNTNMNHLRSVKKYLASLETYKDRIEENISEGNKYEDNIEIWENDVQIVTSLVQDTISQYIFYEIRDLQLSRTEYQEFFMDMIRFSLIVFAVILMVIIFLSYYIPLSITRPIRKLSEVTEQVAKGNLEVRSQVRSGVEINMLSDSLNTMIDKINELLRQVTEEQVRLRKAEFELLQSQINPHFLYNTLDAIIWLAESGEEKKVVDMVGSLSEFFRTSLNRGEDMVTIKKELQHVRSYLEIQQMRYQDILRYEIQVPEELYRYLIPKITIQPLVENALYHGIKNKRGFGQIVISGKIETGHFVIQVKDNGIGITEERLTQVNDGIRDKVLTGNDIYGLYNVNERIRLNFGEKYGLTLESTYGEGTVASLSLPYMEGEKTES
ncbi:sensor histidine kinase [Bariatricus massiliensis]|uniref:Sensor histidine kinase n=1 Tax=Bariatricus massiliensis TaxID=1745713 RepID=A0ABS8DF00_9FIRM|nr:sensor histidine kinase [Bariatricus massiliensis]MCB7303090.1 sensor histidine kinase [Bariatricus massiliensis]MCB7374306.1 sensor histidine kinase [Bariatricus massiliensis]MCB7386976.1 sensor histidine kinase [Bariatricus massiliensis]MCB7411138.1 sensor histidine kinase [Bariatricus massiliensis]MCQ5251964.1 sensor histidine kinase [Bariatricus massiliensis]